MVKGILKFNHDRCKGCELCVVACPRQILKLHETQVNSMGYHPISVTDMDLCVACGACALMCPDGVISIYAEEDTES